MKKEIAEAAPIGIMTIIKEKIEEAENINDLPCIEDLFSSFKATAYSTIAENWTNEFLTLQDGTEIELKRKPARCFNDRNPYSDHDFFYYAPLTNTYICAHCGTVQKDYKNIKNALGEECKLFELLPSDWSTKEVKEFLQNAMVIHEDRDWRDLE